MFPGRLGSGYGRGSRRTLSAFVFLSGRGKRGLVSVSANFHADTISPLQGIVKRGLLVGGGYIDFFSGSLGLLQDGGSLAIVALLQLFHCVGYCIEERKINFFIHIIYPLSYCRYASRL